MNSRFKKIILLLLAAAMLAGSGRLQKSLNHERAQLGLTRADVLENAPPVLAFTTVALGGFRGLISNYLWMRANDLEQDDKFFEAAQLADWITDLEPHFTQVWLFQGWNMAYNISVKFKDFSDRWRWVERGIELLRDYGLRYNPDDLLIYRELAWFFEHKMGQNLDDANVYYKQEWAKEMMPLFGASGTNFENLLHPQTAEERTNALVLVEKYKIDPVFAQKVDAQWGPLDWRLPEAHAIYWGARGLDAAKKNPDKVKQDDVITVRRNIYQSMLQAFQHGRLVMNRFDQSYELYPNLDLIPKVNDSYEQMMREDEKFRSNIATGHQSFLKNAVYFLYENDRIADAEKWFRYLGEKYPDKTLIMGRPDSYPTNVTLDEFAVATVQEDIGETSQDRVTSVVEGLLLRSYYQLTIGQDDRAAGFKLLAGKVYQNYEKQINKGMSNEKRIGLPPFADINRIVLNQLLDPQQGVPFEMRAVLRTQLGLPAETNAPSISTNAIPPAVLPETNAPATNSIGK